MSLVGSLGGVAVTTRIPRANTLGRSTLYAIVGVMLSDVLDSKLSDVALRRSLPTPDACRRIRDAAGFTQADIAEILGVSERTVIRWEHGLAAPARRTNALAYARLIRELAEYPAAREDVTATNK